MNKFRLKLIIGSTTCLSLLAFVLSAYAQQEQAELQAPWQSLGKGSYLKTIPAGASAPPRKVYLTQDFQGHVPTNDWCSSLAWLPFSERHYAHPLAMQAEKGGLRVFYPGPYITANEHAIFGFMPSGEPDVLLGHSKQNDFPAASLAKVSDWFITSQWKKGTASLELTYGHGSPFVFGKCKGGSPQVSLPGHAEIWYGGEGEAVIGFTYQKSHYAIFGTTGTEWTGTKSLTWVNTRKESVQADICFTLAVLPKQSKELLQFFGRYAHQHVTGSKVSWQYDESTSQLKNTYSVKTETVDSQKSSESAKQYPGTLLALYPHQWRHTSAKLLPHTFDSVRGTMKLFAGESFQTITHFPGVLPGLPASEDFELSKLRKLIDKELTEVHLKEGIHDTYAEGKKLHRLTSLLLLVSQYPDEPELTELSDQLLTFLKGRLAEWFSAHQDGKAKGANCFAYDPLWGTLIGYRDSFGSGNELNDHHFHYGYFLHTAAIIAAFDLKWAEETQWGAMVKLIQDDIACPKRNDRLFPFLRAFDPYAGHSWASGHARFGDGNNQESSSEAMLAWTSLILWGELTNNRETRDLGIFLYTTEMTAIHEYWFDIHQSNFPPTYKATKVPMIWGGKGANGTWFSGNAEVVHGINFLPLHGGSCYLGHDPKTVKRNIDSITQENKGKPWDEWADVIWMYEALADGENAWKRYLSRSTDYPAEKGVCRPHLHNWLLTMKAFGQPLPTVNADHPFTLVFQKENVRSYIYWQATEQADKPQFITFSDGTRLSVTKAGYHVKQLRLKE